MPCSASLFATVPTSGLAPELHFSASTATSSNWTWVEFADGSEHGWFGSFRGGSGGKSKVAAGEKAVAIVLARGCGYIVDIAARAVRGELPEAHYQDVVSIPESDLFAVSTWCDVAIVNAGGVLWKTQRLAWDGIRLTSASPKAVHGIAEDWDDERARPFVIDLDRRTATGGSVDDLRADGPSVA